MHATDLTLQLALRKLIDDHRSAHDQLSTAALNFRRNQSYATLKYLASRPNGAASQWRLVRHGLGRLGSWAKGVKFITRFADCEDFRCLLDRFIIKSVPSPDASPVPRSTTWSQYRSILERVLPRYNVTLLEKLFQQCTNGDDGFAVTELEKLSREGFKPVMHTELSIICHFSSEDLDFAWGDSYIACSKGPCFCCELYARHHPRRFDLRPSHGNAYPKWALPAAPVTRKAPLARIQAGMLDNMITEMRVEIEKTLFAANAKGRRLPDSTTGMTTSRQSA